jgi:putative salt-induced outer membrane protein
MFTWINPSNPAMNKSSMNKKINTKLLASVLLAAAGNTMAADEAKSPWTSSAELGYVTTSGNTNTTSLNAKFDIAYEVEKWKHTGHAETLQSKTRNDTTGQDEETAHKSLATYQADYKFTELDYALGLLSYEDDRFSGFEYQAKAVIGYGRKIIINENMTLNLELGPGDRKYKPDNMPSEDDGFIYLAAKYLWNITPTSKFSEDLTANYGDKQDEWKSVTALSAKINSSLAMKLTYTVKYLDVVPAGSDNYDRETAVTLVYSF